MREDAWWWVVGRGISKLLWCPPPVSSACHVWYCESVARTEHLIRTVERTGPISLLAREVITEREDATATCPGKLLVWPTCHHWRMKTEMRSMFCLEKIVCDTGLSCYYSGSECFAEIFSSRMQKQERSLWENSYFLHVCSGDNSWNEISLLF